MITALIPAGSIGAEVGVYCGDFAKDLAATQLSKLFLVDPWCRYPGFDHDRLNFQDHDYAYNRTCEGHKADILDGRVVVMRGFSNEVAEAWTGPKLKWVYLDGNHAYEYIRQDLHVWSRLLEPDGFIMGHDWVPDTTACSVRRAVNGFCGEENWELFALTATNNQPPIPQWENIPSFAIRRKVA